VDAGRQCQSLTIRKIRGDTLFLAHKRKGHRSLRGHASELPQASQGHYSCGNLACRGTTTQETAPVVCSGGIFPPTARTDAAAVQWVLEGLRISQTNVEPAEIWQIRKKSVSPALYPLLTMPTCFTGKKADMTTEELIRLHWNAVGHSLTTCLHSYSLSFKTLAVVISTTAGEYLLHTQNQCNSWHRYHRRTSTNGRGRLADRTVQL
jgi:hypothetical protein